MVGTGKELNASHCPYETAAYGPGYGCAFGIIDAWKAIGKANTFEPIVKVNGQKLLGCNRELWTCKLKLGYRTCYTRFTVVLKDINGLAIWLGS